MDIDNLNRYVWLINTLTSRGPITFEEISDLWKRSSLGTGDPLPRKTFCNHRDAIKNIFGVSIVCNRHNNRYYIDNLEILKNDQLKHWLCNHYSILNQIEADRTLKDRILLDEIPSGQTWLTFITQAMHDNRVLRIDYKGFESDDTYSFEIEPYGLRLSHRRWYLIARSPYYSEMNQKMNRKPKDVYRVYALDRIINMEELKVTFRMNENFSLREYFEHCCGVHNDTNDSVVHLVIKAYENFPAYLRTLPLHSSQKEVSSNEDYAIFEYYVKVNHELYQTLLNCTDQIEVLEPKLVRDKMKEFAENLMKYYGKESADNKD